MTQLLLKENCTVTITHSKTKDLKAEIDALLEELAGVAEVVEIPEVPEVVEVAKKLKEWKDL